MMRRLAWTMGVLLGASCCALSISGCDDDDNSSSGDDSGPETSVTAPPPTHEASTPDATTEGGASDAGADGDATMGETSTADASDGSACTPIEASLDEASIQAGSTLATQYKCSNCHGSGLTGNMMSVVDGGMVYPPNLTPDPVTGIGCWTQAQVTRAILDGIDNDNQTLCVMPHFRGKFMEAGVDPDAAANQIAEFLLSAPPLVRTVPDTVCPNADGGAATTDAAGD